ncbi:MAG: CaiB/BaiF CoA-transferase family protein [Actinomycetota bacterium]|nr:CaiB/BaiF CoA-transferase family protein [Actinomycetota bacterium]MEC9059617.1 CaiB/BaiF CoA-transferase family protein [Actinomycetota bacterium]MED5361401.1 CaiB/BaiF CoA-transferase family protein [Actinomycetota bacterium]
MKKEDFYRNARRDLPGPLAGVRVIDATTAWAGPMASCLLADYGADVIRVAMPGDQGATWQPFIGGTSRSFAEETINRNKRSVAIDLRRPEGVETFLTLVTSADVVVENFKPGTLAGWGIGYDDCQKVKQDIVYLSVSGWGQFGPESQRPGYDPGALAHSGWMALNGEKEGSPSKAPTFLADDLSGLHGALAVLAALRHRDVTGEGQHVDVSLLDSIIYQSNGYLTLGATGDPLERWGSEVRVCAPTNCYECSDGHVFLALILDSHWVRLTEVLGCPELGLDPRYLTNEDRVAHRSEVDSLVADWCRERSQKEVVSAVDAAGIVVSAVNTFADAAKDPHVLERDLLQETKLIDGSTAPLTGPAAKFSRTPTAVRHGAPRPNQHTDEILEEVGVTREQLAQLREAGVID